MQRKRSRSDTTSPFSALLNKRTRVDQSAVRSKQGAVPIVLSPAQQAIVDFVVPRRPGELPPRSVFITGPGGVGKSHVLSATIEALREHFKDSDGAVAVTGSTGLAAFEIQGVTLHRFAGVGLQLDTDDTARLDALARDILQDKDRKMKRVRDRWQKTRVLIIDEVSMVHPRVLEALDYLARVVRHNGQPFGGIRLVFCGDFLQLPPVNKSSGKAAPDTPEFAFETAAWRRLDPRVFYLHHSFRQGDAPTYAAMLNEIRLGKPSQATLDALRQRLIVHAPVPSAPSGAGAVAAGKRYAIGGLVTYIYPKNHAVDAANAIQLAKLPSELRVFHATDYVANEKLRHLLADVRAPSSLELKVGAQVMLLRNLCQEDDPDTAGLVNGAVGRIAGFVPAADPDGDDNDNEASGRNRAKKKAVARVVDANGKNEVPLVVFPPRVPGQAAVPRRIEPVAWEILDGSHANRMNVDDDGILASRTQIPLQLSYAISVHKSQGQTISCSVVADLGDDVFAYGQAYVALSRVKRLEQLHLEHFSDAAIRAHPRAVAYYEALDKTTP